MLRRLSRQLLLLASSAWCGTALAQTPPLLANAIAQWTAGAGDIAFTQRARVLQDDGAVKEERLERYDPSLPDSRRWHLLELNGRPPTEEVRAKFEGKKNGKPRRQIGKSPLDYLDVEHAVLVKDTMANGRFEVGLRPESSRLLALEKIAVLITVEKEHGTIAHIAATLREPMRVLLGVAHITDFDLDVGIEPPGENSVSAPKSGEVKSDSTATVKMSKFGFPTEYRWSDFKRVTTFDGGKEADAPNGIPADKREP